MSPPIRPHRSATRERQQPVRAARPRHDARAGSASWMTHGACLGTDPELFFPVAVTGATTEQVSSAKAVCGRCQVRENCLSYALRAMPHGIWGGTTRQERIAMRDLVAAGSQVRAGGPCA